MVQERIPLFREFEDWLNQQDYENDRSRKCIISRLRHLDKKYLGSIHTGDFKKDPKTGRIVERTIWDILDSIMKNPRGPKRNYVEDLMTAIMSRVKKDSKRIAEKNGLKDRTVENYSSALNTYYIFLIERLAALKVRQVKLTPNEEATIENINEGKIELDQKQLIAIFASRMNTQDRCSGDKVFLPLGLIGKIFKKNRQKELRIL